MPFQKDHEPMGGRPKGAPNKNNANAESLNRVMGFCEELIEEDLKKLSPIERIKLWEKLNEYKFAKISKTPNKNPFWEA